MKKIQVLVLALFAVFAFGAIAATAAFAEETEYLESGGPVKIGELVDSEGELLLADHKGGPFGEEVMVLCSGENLGEVVSLTDIDITAVYPLGATDPEKGAGVTCTVQAGTCPNPAIATPVHLPWLAELMLEGTTLVALLVTSGAGEPGWTVSCGGIAEDECIGELEKTTLEVKNETNGTVDTFFNEQAGHCSRGGNGSALVEGLVIILSVTSGLTVEVMGS